MRNTDWTIFPVIVDYLKLVGKRCGFKVKTWRWKIYVKTARHLRVANPDEIMRMIRTGEFKHWITRLQKEAENGHH